MNAPEPVQPAADNALSATQATCEECGDLFTPKRGWGRFCKAKCRNDFHGRERRIEAIRAAALPMYRTLASIAGTEGPLGDQARAAIRDLKPPVEPKALLEKAKA